MLKITPASLSSTAQVSASVENGCCHERNRIDVLAAQALGLTQEELGTLYRIQFPVLRQNENDTWHDRRGRIVFTRSKGLPGVGFPRVAKPKEGEPVGWVEIKDLKSGTVEGKVKEDLLPGGKRERTIVHEAPFDKCGREPEYAAVWKEFAQRAKAGNPG